MHQVRTLFCRLQPSHQLFVLAFFPPPGLEQRKGKKKKKGEKRKQAKLGVPDTVNTGLPLRSSLPNLHSLHILCFFHFWGGPDSLPPEISSNSSHVSHQLLPGPALQAPKSGHQAEAACDQTGLCLPAWPRSPVSQVPCCWWDSAHHLLLPTQQPGEEPSLTPASAARTDQGERSCP